MQIQSKGQQLEKSDINKSYIHNINNFSFVGKNTGASQAIYFMKSLRGISQTLSTNKSLNKTSTNLPYCHDKKIKCQSQKHCDYDIERTLPHIDHLLRKRLGPTINLGLANFEISLRNYHEKLDKLKPQETLSSIQCTKASNPHQTNKSIKSEEKQIYLKQNRSISSSPYTDLPKKNIAQFRQLLKDKNGTVQSDIIRWEIQLKNYHPRNDHDKNHRSRRSISSINSQITKDKPHKL